MADTITTYSGGSESVAPIDARPDPRQPGRFLIKNQEGRPMRGKLSLADHAYNVVLLPDSYIIIDADETELFKNSSTDDRVIFVVPSEQPNEFYVEQYIAATKGQSPYTAIILRQRKPFAMVSGVLYPRDLTELPQPLFMTAGGRIGPAVWKEKSEIDDVAKAEHAHGQHDLDRILRAVHQQDRKPVIDPDAPKKDWF